MTQCALAGRPSSPSHDGLDAEISTPAAVHVIRVLGHGRAAQARLVDATMPDGSVVRCVEKVFAPGRLTQLIYRLSFQSPFAYQSNSSAIRACFYRRRVAGAILAASDLDVDIALPLYVRFDSQLNAWVLAARWINGRGIKPAPADPGRISRLFRTVTTRGRETRQSEVDELVQQMGQVERLLIESGLTGSGWQVAPRALVSTANLLRVDERYTIIDLESGIPAVLVPKYLLDGFFRGSLPPFDDLDASRLRSWLCQNERLLVFRLGPDAVVQLKRDIDQLIEQDAAWKSSELALLRRPWQLFTRRRLRAYRRECLRRWKQAEDIDETTARSLSTRPALACLIWCAGMLPGRLGRFARRWLGRKETRQKLGRFLRDATVRRTTLLTYRNRTVDRWRASGRIADTQKVSGVRFVLHRLLQWMPAKLHRLLVDPTRRREVSLKLLLMLFSSRFQAHVGRRHIETSIDRWQDSQRITQQQADELRSDLSGDEVRVYTRGFGMHLALKALAPIFIPAKLGGIAAFVASGNGWFLIPLLLTPVLRVLVTLASWRASRHLRVPHGEALLISWMPTIGSVAFPFQMFARRPELSTFLIRDAASRVGRKLPIYGGADSRTELAAVRVTDYLIAIMQWATSTAQRVRGTRSQDHLPVTPTTLAMPRRTRFGRWLEIKTSQQIVAANQEESQAPDAVSAAA